MKNELKLRFTGVADLKPHTLRSKEIGELITAFEAAIAATVVDHDSDIRREHVAVPLVSIQDESVGFAFTPNLPDLTYPALFRIADAFASNQFSKLPNQALEPLRVIVRFVKIRGCNAELKIAHDQQEVSIAITPDTNIEAAIAVEGETVLYGQVIRTGGVDPKVEIKTISGKALFCSTTEEITLQLANRLYQQVGVLGHAKWNYETLEIKEFRIIKVLPYAHTPISEAFGSLRKVAAGAFDTIKDVDQYINSIRYDEDGH